MIPTDSSPKDRGWKILKLDEKLKLERKTRKKCGHSNNIHVTFLCVFAKTVID